MVAVGGRGRGGWASPRSVSVAGVGWRGHRRLSRLGSVGGAGVGGRGRGLWLWPEVVSVAGVSLFDRGRWAEPRSVGVALFELCGRAGLVCGRGHSV